MGTDHVWVGGWGDILSTKQVFNFLEPEQEKLVPEAGVCCTFLKLARKELFLHFEFGSS